MEIIREALSRKTPGLSRIQLKVDRTTLAKRRWRGVAEDGREFGFDLHHPLADGDAFFGNGPAIYVIEQKPELVLEIRIADTGLHHAADFARLGWMIGNLHFPLALDGDTVLTADDPALRQLFERERIAFTAGERVFRPLAGAHSHEH
jgi:urease accessory protein